jgi:mannose-6-phosphate isomerase-like protein (cupin superfamily)
MTEGHSGGAYVAARGEGRKLFIGTLQVSAEQSGGAVEVIVLNAPAGTAGPAGPPPHVHRQRDELFYIVKGRLSFVLGTREFEVEEGGTVFVPRGTRHGFKSQPDSQALLIIAPAGLEGFFAELGDGLAAGKSNEEIRTALAGKYDSTAPTSKTAVRKVSMHPATLSERRPSW